jgi:hypothetical protein
MKFVRPGEKNILKTFREKKIGAFIYIPTVVNCALACCILKKRIGLINWQDIYVRKACFLVHNNLKKKFKIVCPLHIRYKDEKLFTNSSGGHSYLCIGDIKNLHM